MSPIILCHTELYKNKAKNAYILSILSAHLMEVESSSVLLYTGVGIKPVTSLPLVKNKKKMHLENVIQII